MTEKDAPKSASRGQRGHSTAAKPAPARRWPRLLGRLLLLLLIAGGAGAAGWLWLEHQQAMEARLAALEADAVVREEFEAEAAATGETLQALEREWQATRALLDDLRPLASGGRAAWLRAEVLYLLRTANWNLRLAGDPALSLEALRLADARLEELGDPALLPVREVLADEIVALEGLPRPDIAGMALKLTGMARQSRQWPLLQADVPEARLKLPDAGQVPAVNDDRPAWRRVLASLAEVGRGLVVVRRHDEPLEPLLPPEQAYFQRLNAELQLDGARVALLRRDEALFHQQVDTAELWIRRYFDADDSRVAAALVTLSEWRETDIAPPRPQITGALERMQEVHVRPPEAAAADGESSAATGDGQ